MNPLKGGKSIVWPEGPVTSFVACGTLQPASFWDPESALDDVGRDSSGNAQEVVLTGVEPTEDELIKILRSLSLPDLVKIFIAAFEGK